MKARDLLNAVEQWQAMRVDPEKALQQLTDEQLRTAVLVAAEVFKSVKNESVRRGIWSEFKGVKVGG